MNNHSVINDNTNKSIIKKFSKSERFVNERKEYWQELQSIIDKINKRGQSSLNNEENIEFPNLYRKICSDAELAKTLELSPDTIRYINTLLQYSHNILYSSPKRKLKNIAGFFINDFSKSFIKNWKPIFIIFLLFFGIGLVSFIIVLNNPDYAIHILPEQWINMMKESYSKDITEHRDIYSNIVMAGFYIKNNVSIAFLSFVLGVTFGIGTIFLIIRNAIFIGAVAGVVVSSGYSTNFFNFVVAHSAFELLGICLAGGAGLAVGLSMIITTEEKKTKTFNNKAKEVMPVLFTAALFITIAGFIEGFISPTKTPILIKITIALISLFIILFFSYKLLFIKFIRNYRMFKRINATNYRRRLK